MRLNRIPVNYFDIPNPVIPPVKVQKAVKKEARHWVTCEVCGGKFEALQSRTKICGPKCRSRAWRKENPEKRRAFKKTIPQKIRAAVAKRLRDFKVSKIHKTVVLIGCSLPQLRGFLESKFGPGMSWDNYGRYGWHIDHKQPCSSFDLSDPEQQKQCFHYTNLQPMWWLDNLRKGAKIIFQTPINQ